MYLKIKREFEETGNAEVDAHGADLKRFRDRFHYYGYQDLSGISDVKEASQVFTDDDDASDFNENK
jgi:hypothetical protein